MLQSVVRNCHNILVIVAQNTTVLAEGIAAILFGQGQ